MIAQRGDIGVRVGDMMQWHAGPVTSVSALTAARRPPRDHPPGAVLPPGPQQPGRPPWRHRRPTPTPVPGETGQAIQGVLDAILTSGAQGGAPVMVAT